MAIKYKAFIADIDGTLTGKGENILPRTREALIRLHEAGADIGLATGRPLDHRISGRAEAWNLGFSFDVLIGMNGGELWDKYTGRIEREHMLERETLRRILGFMLEADVNAQIFADGYDLVKALRNDPQLEGSIKRNHSTVQYVSPEELCEVPACKLEFHYEEAIEETVMRIVEAHPDPAWAAVRTFPGTVEFMDPRVNKGSALRKFCRHAGIAPEEVIACGDMENDIPMMEAAGLGICLLNGSAAARTAADEVTRYPVGEDGLGRHILSTLFSERDGTPERFHE